MSVSQTFGVYGGRYVPETLIPALDELESAWASLREDDSFRAELHHLLTTYAGRPTPLTRVERFAPDQRMYLKREDLMHTGAHKINNAVGQALIAQRLGKKRIIAETGAGQHGVATATVCARFGLECIVYMGSEDIRRQAPNVERMNLLGAEVRPVEFGTRTLKEATSEAIRDWIANVDTTYYLIGSCVGPAPYPEIVRELQRVIGRETREQILQIEDRLPETVVACVGGGSNAIGMFYDFVPDEDVRLIGVEAAGAASLGTGRPGVLHGARSSLLADEDGQFMVALDLGRPRLSRRRPRARLPARHGPCRVPPVHGRRGARCVPPALRNRGHRPGTRVVARTRARTRLRRRARRRVPLRARRQGSRGGARPMKKLVVYLMAMPDTPELVQAAVEAGADIIELGFPFSDPLADGPVIRRAGERALAAGMRTKRCLEVLAETRARVSVPLVLMTYASIFDAYGWERLETDARAAGATSFIVVDLPADIRPELKRVQLVAPTSTDDRLKLAAAATDEWLYLVTVTGTTGARTELAPSLAPLAKRARAVTDVPLYAGFGISTPEHARAAGELVDGIAVGSRAVEAAEKGPAELARFVASLRTALDAVA